MSAGVDGDNSLTGILVSERVMGPYDSSAVRGWCKLVLVVMSREERERIEKEEEKTSWDSWHA